MSDNIPEQKCICTNGEQAANCDRNCGHGNEPEQKKYPVGCYAPGNYWGHCVTCGKQFQGDKMATQCEPCGTKAQQEYDSLTPEQQEERGRKNMELYNELVAGKSVEDALAALENYNNKRHVQE